MRTRLRLSVVAAAMLTGLSTLAAVGAGSAVQASPAPIAPAITTQHACGAAAPGMATCHAVVRTDAGAHPNAATPSGYFPADLRSAYNLTSTGSSSQTIAIVDAYDDPTAEADLGVYRNQFGLPAAPPSSATAGAARTCPTPRTARTSTTRASRSPLAPATPATAPRTRLRRAM
jgi:hypothetical protein